MCVVGEGSVCEVLRESVEKEDWRECVCVSQGR